MKKTIPWIAIAFFSFFITGNTAEAKTAKGVVSSKHNLSISGPGRVKADINQPVCSFCHTPHVEGHSQPMWQKQTKLTYITYKSSTVKATIGQPTGASRLCLSCHDGTVALGMAQARKNVKVNMTKMPAGASNLGLDLSDDHPISFVYDSALATKNGQLEYPSALQGLVKLDSDGQLQCTSCHSPHNDKYGKFLVIDNRFSGLCTVCHRIENWSMSTHNSSNASWNGASPDPWPYSSYTTVAGNACENCHVPHNAGGRQRLLNYEREEENCFSCHNGNVALSNIEREFGKPSRHPIDKTMGVHLPDEDPIWSPRHVECEDCHNPHATNANPGNPPVASGKISWAAGVSSSGTPVKPLRFEYELCYRCHGDNPGGRTPTVTRHVFEKNLRLKFRSSNASYHPVEAIGKNRNVPSLIIPYTSSTRIYCTDCHNSNSRASGSGTAPGGPHGSIWHPILERQLMTTDSTSESANVYSLCYKCHNRNSILADQSFSEHSLHIVDEKTPCTACHDSHGVEENSHLINFDKTIVSLNDSGLLSFKDNGRYAGSCSLKCHNENHNQKEYPENQGSSIKERKFRGFRRNR